MFQPRKAFALAAILCCSLLAPGGSPADAAEPLDILVFGATGKIGTRVVTEALERGHHVTAVSRDPASIGLRHANLTVARGDLLDAPGIAALVPGRDVVIVSVRGVVGDPRDPENALQYLAARNLVEALRHIALPRPRLLHVGGAGTLETEPGVLLADELPRIFLPRKLEAEIDGQVLALELLRSVDDIAWTYITPPKNFTNGPRTGSYRIGGDLLLEDARGRSRVSRADFAAAIVDEAESAAHVQRRFSVAY